MATVAACASALVEFAVCAEFLAQKIELPVLRLGLAGFTSDQELAIASVARGAVEAQWESGPLAGADAWLINGARAQILEAGEFRVASGVPGGRSLRLWLDQAERPVAFCKPLPARLQATWTCDLADPDSVAQALAKLEPRLRCIKARYWFASTIVDHEQTLLGRHYELRTHGRLIAALDMRGQTAVSAAATPAELHDAEWAAVSQAPGLLPEEFCRTPLDRLLWQYFLRSGRDALPKRYRTGMIYFRRPPRVEQREVSDEHLLVMRELATGPLQLSELQLRTGMSEHRLAQILSALYFVGSITSSSHRAAESIRSRLTTVDGELIESLTGNPQTYEDYPTAPLLT